MTTKAKTTSKKVSKPKKKPVSRFSLARLSGRARVVSLVVLFAVVGTGSFLYGHTGTTAVSDSTLDASAAGAAASVSCAQYSFTIIHDQNKNPYALNNDRYGNGNQCASNTNGGTNFTVYSGGTAPAASNNVEAYPNMIRGCSNSKCYSPTWPKEVGTLPSWLASSRFASNGASGSWDANYDMWFNRTDKIGQSRGTEILINLDRANRSQPTIYWSKHNTTIENSAYTLYVIKRSQKFGNTTYNWNFLEYWRQKATTTTTNLNLTQFMQNAEAWSCPYSSSCIQPTWYWTGVDSGYEIWYGGYGLTWYNNLIEAE
jgi:hypothetical protein